MSTVLQSIYILAAGTASSDELLFDVILYKRWNFTFIRDKLKKLMSGAK